VSSAACGFQHAASSPISSSFQTKTLPCPKRSATTTFARRVQVQVQAPVAPVLVQAAPEMALAQAAQVREPVRARVPEASALAQVALVLAPEALVLVPEAWALEQVARVQEPVPALVRVALARVPGQVLALERAQVRALAPVQVPVLAPEPERAALAHRFHRPHRL